jgi:hypothetical protein
MSIHNLSQSSTLSYIRPELSVSSSDPEPVEGERARGIVSSWTLFFV